MSATTVVQALQWTARSESARQSCVSTCCIARPFLLAGTIGRVGYANRRCAQCAVRLTGGSPQRRWIHCEQPMRSLLTLGPAANRPIKLTRASRSDGSVSIGSWLKLIIICMDTCAEQHALCTSRYNACCITMLHRQLAEVISSATAYAVERGRVSLVVVI